MLFWLEDPRSPISPRRISFICWSFESWLMILLRCWLLNMTSFIFSMVIFTFPYLGVWYYSQSLGILFFVSTCMDTWELAIIFDDGLEFEADSNYFGPLIGGPISWAKEYSLSLCTKLLFLSSERAYSILSLIDCLWTGDSTINLPDLFTW